MKKIGGGWIKQGKKMEYISAQIEIDGKKINFMIFKNTRKAKETHPDYEICMRDDNEKKENNAEEKPKDFDDCVAF